VEFDDNAGVWRERQSLTTRDGLTSAQTLLLRPIADGMCRVQLEHEPAHSGVRGGGVASGRGHAAGAAAGNGVAGHARGGVGASAGGGRMRAGSGSSAGMAGTGGGYGHGHGHGGGRQRDDMELTLTEQSDAVLLLVGVSHATGRPLLVETITLQSDMARVRTVQRFDDDGDFQVLYLIREERVIDAVTGSIMRM
jgi:hypothetical protein